MQIAVATPGRMLDLIRMKACAMVRTTYLVLDEADRMFEMGFETQVRALTIRLQMSLQSIIHVVVKTYEMGLKTLVRALAIHLQTWITM